MARLEELTKDALLVGVVPAEDASVIDVGCHDSNAMRPVYRDCRGYVANWLLMRDDESTLEIRATGCRWSFDSEGAIFWLKFRTLRIRLAHFADSLQAAHS